MLRELQHERVAVTLIREGESPFALPAAPGVAVEESVPRESRRVTSYPTAIFRFMCVNRMMVFDASLSYQIWRVWELRQYP